MRKMDHLSFVTVITSGMTMPFRNANIHWPIQTLKCENTKPWTPMKNRCFGYILNLCQDLNKGNSSKRSCSRSPKHQQAKEITWRSVEIITNMRNKGNISLLTSPKWKYANPQSSKPTKQSDVTQITDEAPLINVLFIQRTCRRIRRESQP